MAENPPGRPQVPGGADPRGGVGAVADGGQDGAVGRRREYFDQQGLEDQALRFAQCTRVQLDRWEPLVLAHLFGKEEASPADTWRARNEHHLLLVAAAHLVSAADALQPPLKGTPDVVRRELVEARDLVEHWRENQPIFNTTPRPAEPKFRTGRAFAARNPRKSPYFGLSWTLSGGPSVTPNVSSVELHALIDRVEHRVLSSRPEMARFVVPHTTLEPGREP